MALAEGKQQHSSDQAQLEHKLVVHKFAGGDEALPDVKLFGAAGAQLAAHPQFPGIGTGFDIFHQVLEAWAPYPRPWYGSAIMKRHRK